MGWSRRFAPAVALALGGILAAQGWGQSSAAQVKVLQVDSLGNTLAEEAYVYTDEAFTSVEAPERAGQRFTHWEVSPAQPGFANRDAWGRALDAVTVTPKDAVVTLTAVYADAAADTDGDGVADAEERYWYGAPGGYDTAGSLKWDGASDTDGDGYTFAEELQAGMNPLFPNRLVLGGVATPATATSCSTTRTNTSPTRCARSRRGRSSRPTRVTRGRGRRSRRRPSRPTPPPSPTGR